MNNNIKYQGTTDKSSLIKVAVMYRQTKMYLFSYQYPHLTVLVTWGLADVYLYFAWKIHTSSDDVWF